MINKYYYFLKKMPQCERSQNFSADPRSTSLPMRRISAESSKFREKLGICWGCGDVSTLLAEKPSQTEGPLWPSQIRSLALIRKFLSLFVKVIVKPPLASFFCVIISTIRNEQF